MFFLEFSYYFCDPTEDGSLISGSSAFSKYSFYIWKFLVHALLKPSRRILSITLLACGSLNILLHCPSFGLEWKLTFSSPVATAEFSKFAGILSAAL